MLERLISEKAQLQLARETGIKVDEATVDQAEQNVARQNQIDVAELRRRLAADGIALAQFREDLRNQLLLTRLRERELEPRVKVSDLDVDQFLREQQQGGNDAAALELNLAHILVAVPENATEAQVASLRSQGPARAAARPRRRGLRQAGARVFRCARRGRQRRRGRPAHRRPLSAAVRPGDAQALPEGGVSDLVRSGAGFHVIKVLEKRQRRRARHRRHAKPRPPHPAAPSAAAERERGARSGWPSSRSASRPARPISRSWRARTRRTRAPRNGGDLGWASPGLFVPEFEEAMNSLAPGQIADPLVSRFGVHLIQLLERRQATLSQREQREVARNLVREKKLDEAYAHGRRKCAAAPTWSCASRRMTALSHADRPPPRAPDPAQFLNRSPHEAHPRKRFGQHFLADAGDHRRDRARDRSAARPGDGGDRAGPGGADAAAGGAPRASWP